MASNAAEIQKHLKTYYMVFGALAVLTVVTVAIAMLDLDIVAAVLVAMFVASIKGTLVACYFMHLISERGLIFWVLGLCAVFFVVLLLLPVVTSHDYGEGARYIQSISG